MAIEIPSTGDELARLRDYVDRIGRSPSRRLPPEPKLSVELDVSRGRLRTLLKHLEAEGLIWRHVGKGTFAGPRQPASGDRSWTDTVSVDAYFEARILLEPQLAAQAAIHATSADLATMEACLTEMADATTFVHWKQLDEKLHRVIAAATHNVLLLILYDTMRSQVKLRIEARLAEIFGGVEAPRHATDLDHRGIVKAIAAHNPALAEERMRAHLLSVRQALFGSR